MFKEGIGESGSFISMHPVIIASYYLMVIGILMFSNHPIFLVSALFIGLAYDMLLRGYKSLRRNAIMIFFITVLTVLINALFTHNGSSVLFYIGTNRVTVEAAAYGLMIALMLCSVIIWFSSFNVVMTSEKFIYIFGRLAPVLGLTLSMIFRFIPLLKTRFTLISDGQKALGAADEKGFLRKIRRLAKEVSILISWSLETSIESADSMAARGYGLKGRTSYSLFKFKSSDIYVLVATIMLGMATAFSYVKGYGRLYFYPVIKSVAGEGMPIEILGLTSFIILLLIPISIDLIGEYRWKKSKSRI